MALLTVTTLMPTHGGTVPHFHAAMCTECMVFLVKKALPLVRVGEIRQRLERTVVRKNRHHRIMPVYHHATRSKRPCDARTSARFVQLALLARRVCFGIHVDPCAVDLDLVGDQTVSARLIAHIRTA